MFRVKEFLAFFSKTIAERTEKGVRQSVEENGKTKERYYLNTIMLAYRPHGSCLH